MSLDQQLFLPRLDLMFLLPSISAAEIPSSLPATTRPTTPPTTRLGDSTTSVCGAT
jgi:hypothetical protein